MRMDVPQKMMQMIPTAGRLILLRLSGIFLCSLWKDLLFV